MTSLKKILWGFGLTGLALGFLLVAMVLTSARSAVNWRNIRAIVLESDDWGLAGFAPTLNSWHGLDRDALQTGKFPEVYWNSTLEDSQTVADIVSLMESHRGRDGLPAVFQANYVMKSLHWETATDQWVTYDLPQWPPQYDRPGLWSAVRDGMDRGVWRPEYHATYHYDPIARQKSALTVPDATTATERGIMLFPGSEAAREWSVHRDEDVMTKQWRESKDIFVSVFGRPPTSIIAADYVWHGWAERLWVQDGVRVIQAKREQRNSLWLAGRWGRVQKVADRQWTRLWHPERLYLERNCHLEPVQAPEPNAVVQACLAETQAAWRNGEPAIVETHRVNFSHLESGVREKGLSSLADYMAGVLAFVPAPIFLCDTEIAQLQMRGTSWRRSGDSLILRNFSHSTKIVTVPGSAVGRPEPLFFRLAGGEVKEISRH